jgi:hypothetical protein
MFTPSNVIVIITGHVASAWMGTPAFEGRMASVKARARKK